MFNLSRRVRLPKGHYYKKDLALRLGIDELHSSFICKTVQNEATPFSQQQQEAVSEHDEAGRSMSSQTKELYDLLGHFTSIL